MVQTFWSLIPPLLAIGMVLLTRRVLLSLGVGIVASALFVKSFHLTDSFSLIWSAFRSVFWEEGSVNTWNVFILLFVLMLGILTAFVGMMGGTQAFGEWMVKRVKTRAGAHLMTMFLGVIVFIDDYFNSLTVGQIAKPVTDKHRISRAKLAYIVDSTSAPVCVVAPISSWGAYIIGLIGFVLTTHAVTDITAFMAFIYMIPMNFYVWAALGVVLVISLRQVDFGSMKVHEEQALRTGEVKRAVDQQTKSKHMLPTSSFGRISDLIVPIAVLFIATIGFIYWTGYTEVDGSGTLMDIFGEADVAKSLLFGGITSLVVTFILFFKQSKQSHFKMREFFSGVKEGAKSMIPAFLILIFAWTIADLIGELGTGEYLAAVVKQSNISFSLIPFVIFIIAGFIAFSTGTSWGSFALLLPIAGSIAAATDISLLLPLLSAVLAGAVFGDHCSPISDTTILSSTGTECDHIDHVTTQLPYALVSAGIAGLGYLALGLTSSVLTGLIVVLVSLIILFFSLRKKNNSHFEQEKEDTIAN